MKGKTKMKLYTYYAEDDNFYNIIDDIIEANDYSDEILYSNLEIEDEEGKRVFNIDDEDNTITFDYNFFSSFMKNFTNRVIDNYVEHNHPFLKED